MFGSRKMGYFEIPEKAFAHPDIVLEIMSKVIVVEAKFHFDDRCVHYFGISEEFEEVASHTQAPHYNIYCDRRLTEKPLALKKGNVLEEEDWLISKLHTCLTCMDAQSLGCSACNGSGEGMADGSTCQTCKGSGEIRCPDCGMEDV